MTALPPGQVDAPLTRFGLPWFITIRPEAPVRPVLLVTGRVRTPVQLDLAEVMAVAQRRDQHSDLHCVTTWSATGLRWGGVRFRDVHAELTARVAPHRDCAWVVFIGMDGFRACLALSDALAEDVLLVDTLDGAPLIPDHGAPLRLVAPAHYGYKSVRHVCAVEYRTTYDRVPRGWMTHRRGRVAKEERSAVLPGWLWRRIWRRFRPRAQNA